MMSSFGFGCDSGIIMVSDNACWLSVVWGSEQQKKCWLSWLLTILNLLIVLTLIEKKECVMDPNMQLVSNFDSKRVASG